MTLLFSLQRHRQAAEAYIRGLRRPRDDGGDLNTVAFVASFFVSPVDTEADRRLDAIEGHDGLIRRRSITCRVASIAMSITPSIVPSSFRTGE